MSEMQLKCCNSSSFQSLWAEYEKAKQNTTLMRRLSAFGVIEYLIDLTMAWGRNKTHDFFSRFMNF